MIAEGELVAVRLIFRGTHRGTFMGIPPTGKHFEISGIAIDRVRGGKIVEHWVIRDDPGTLQQLGVASIPGRSD